MTTLLKNFFGVRALYGLRVLAWVTLAAGLLIAALYWWRLQVSHEQLRADTLSQASHRAMQLAQAQAGQVETLLLSVDMTLRQYRDAYQSGHSVAARRVAQTAADAFPEGAMDHFLIVNADGYVSESSLRSIGRVFVGDREYFKWHKSHQSDELQVGGAVLSKASGVWVVPLSRSIYRGNEFVGVAVVALSSQYLGSVLARLPMNTGDVISLFYRDGSYVARSRGMSEVMGKVLPPDRPFMQPQAPGLGSFRVEAFADQMARWYAWSRVSKYPLILNVGLDEGSLLKPVEQEITRARWRNLGGTTLILGLCAVLLALLWAAARQQRALSKSQTLLRSTLDSTDDGILVVREDGQVLSANPRFMELWKIPQSVVDVRHDQRLLGLALEQMCDPAQFLTAVKELHGKDDERSDILSLKDGRVMERYSRAFLLDGRRVRLWSFRDITVQKQAEAQHQLAGSVFSNSYEGIMITDAHTAFVDVNPAFVRITGYTKEDVLGKTPRLLASGRHSDGHYAAMWQSLQAHDFWRGEMWNRRKDGEVYTEMLSISVVRDKDGQLCNYIVVAEKP